MRADASESGPACARCPSRLRPDHPSRSQGDHMRGAVMYAPGDVRVEQRDDPRILAPTDAIIRLGSSCICGSDLWPWRGLDEFREPMPMGHEYAGIVVEVGSDVTTVAPGQFVVGSFFASDN